MLGILPETSRASGERRDEQTKKAVAAGKPGVLGGILGVDTYSKELKRRREEVNKKYAQQVRQHYKDWRKRREDLIEDLEKRKEKNDSHYRLEKLTKTNDSRLAHYQKLADRRYIPLERNAWEDFHDAKQAARKELSKQRKAELRQAAHSLEADRKSVTLGNLQAERGFAHDPRRPSALESGPGSQRRYISPRFRDEAERRAA